MSVPKAHVLLNQAAWLKPISAIKLLTGVEYIETPTSVLLDQQRVLKEPPRTLRIKLHSHFTPDSSRIF